MGFPAGGGLPSDLAYLASAVVVFAAMLLPGLGIAWGLGMREGWDWPEIVAASFAFCLGLTGAVALAAYYGHQPLDVVLVSCAVAFVALTGIGVRWGLAGKRPALGRGGLIVAGVAALLAVLERPWMAWTADSYYHLAAARSLLVSGRPMVTDPLYGTPLTVLDPTSGVWQTQLALISRLTHLDVAWLWPGATAVGAAMTLLAFWVLCRTVTRSERAATIGSAGFLVLGLFLDMRWFSYPNHMALALVFLALAGVTRLLDKPRVASAALVVAAGFSAISLHLAAAALIVFAAAWLWLLALVLMVAEGVHKHRWKWRGPLGVAATGVVLAVVSLPLVVPKAAVVSASPLVSYRADMLAAQVLHVPGGLSVASPEMIGTAWTALVVLALLLGVAAAIPAFRDGDRGALAVTAIAILPVALLLDPPLTTLLLQRSAYMTSRIAILLPFTLFVALAWATARWADVDRTSRVVRVLAVVAVVFALWASVPPFLLTFAVAPGQPATNVWISRGNDMRARWGAETVTKMAAALGDGYPIVAGDAVTSYYVAGVFPAAVVAVPDQHSPFAIEEVDGPARRADMEELTSASASENTRREILERRRADFLVMRADSPKYADALARMRTETDLLTPVVDTQTLVLFRVKR
jgi:hypothetical protein